MAAFCRQAALYNPEWDKEHTAEKSVVELCFTFLEVIIVISTDTISKDQCEKAI